MDKKLIQKWLLLLALTAGSLWLVIPPGKKIPLGLDLKGGMSFTVGIDSDKLREQIIGREPELTDAAVQERVDEVMEKAQDRVLEVLRNRIDNLGIAEPSIFPISGNRVTIQLPGVDNERRAEAKKLIFSVAFLEFRMVHEDNDALTDKIFQEGAAPQGYLITQFGGSPCYIRDPAVKDVDVDKEALSRFRLADAGANYEFMLERKKTGAEPVYFPRFVSRWPELTGDYLKNAQVNYEQIGLPTVGIEFNNEGAGLFAAITEAYAPGGSKNPDPNKRRQMGIVLDGTLYSAPTINEAIFGGSAEISGSFKTSEAELLVNILQAGALPAPLIPVGETFVDPTLGHDSIKSGIQSGLIGAAGVLVFMLVFYMFNGLVANAALVMNVMLMPIGMVVAAGFLAALAKMVGQGAMGGSSNLSLPVLTLPGIAGIFLSIGMAVDANVLILERIREELRAGKTLFTAIRAGYDRAFVTIVDANLTTLVTGIALFIFGSGPIRGYAVTLCGGIIVSMYTGIAVTRLIYETIAAKGGTVSLKMLQLVGKTNIDFLSKKTIAIAVSAVLIVATWGSMGVKASKSLNSVLGVDFTGGASVTLEFEQKADVSDVRQALDAAGLTDAHIQYQRDAEGAEQLKIRVGGHGGDASKTAGMIVQEALQANLAASGFTSVMEEDVGPQIGRELKSKAVWATIWSVIGIIIYLSVRFEFGFALGAIVAVAHDVAVALGVYVMLDRQLNLTIIAALLTIIGYSVNDTIVIFDRVREDLRLNRGKTFKDICNQALNETLSRTILTTGATLFVVVAMMVIGGGEVREFATVLFIGMVAGTYSTIFIATPVVLAWYRNVMPALATKKNT